MPLARHKERLHRYGLKCGYNTCLFYRIQDCFRVPTRLWTTRNTYEWVNWKIFKTLYKLIMWARRSGNWQIALEEFNVGIITELDHVLKNAASALFNIVLLKLSKANGWFGDQYSYRNGVNKPCNGQRKNEISSFLLLPTNSTLCLF